MAREINIVSKIEVVATHGLCPPRTAPSAPWCWWHEDGTGKLPEVVRFCWQPQDGRLYAGTQCRHVLQVPKGDPHPFNSFLRGFGFPLSRSVAVRTYFWPQDGYDFFDASHADLHERVVDAFIAALKPILPKRTPIYRSVDNAFLKAKFGHLKLCW